MTHQLVYTSRETYALRADDVIRLLLAARERNRKAGITGLLLYRDGHFMQLLEGGAQSLGALYACIRDDPRHCDIELLMERAADTPLMHGWSMGYADAPMADGRDAFAGLRSERDALALLDTAPSQDAVVHLLCEFLQQTGPGTGGAGVPPGRNPR